MTSNGGIYDVTARYSLNFRCLSSLMPGAKFPPKEKTMSSKSQKKAEASAFVSSGILVCLLIYATIVTLLLFRNFFENFKLECTEEGSLQGTAASEVSFQPYMPGDEEAYLSLLSPSKEVQCQDLQQLTTKLILQKHRTEVGIEAPHICMDTLPKNPTNSNCRIYSIDINQENAYFEIKMGQRGCRVHLIAKIPDMNYGKMSDNCYLYPLRISADPGPAHYTLDDYINLMSHESKTIHIVKTSVNGSEWRFLTTMYTSKIEAWRQIRQLRLVVNIPPLSPATRDEFSLKYLLLRGLRSLGFYLVYSQPLLLEGETPPEQGALAKRYETVWIKKTT